MVAMHLVVMVLCLALARGWAQAATPACGLTSVSISVEGEDCKGCITFNTTSCAGMCVTQDPVYKSEVILRTAPYGQQTCNFREVVYETVRLPGCPEGVDPHFTYPVALSCECSQCNTDTTDCGPVNAEVSGCH
ncbi:hypothetical protein AGOR_G00170900 [Albula goreensis]|uniref:Glycoprotein hormone subunit beta domain-containing protein n=1 Tax=Albula goreensis TaxID=1534307 RepID=A0A8T3CXU3_9TELE|nr:hypothetical protein AGOR_G00170900 [Albula goreensis]